MGEPLILHRLQKFLRVPVGHESHLRAGINHRQSDIEPGNK